MSSNKKEALAKHIIITTKPRGKHQFTTTISGLEEAGLNIKEISKSFCKRFATSASVVASERTKNSKDIVMSGNHAQPAGEELVKKHKISESTIYLIDMGKKSQFKLEEATVGD